MLRERIRNSIRERMRYSLKRWECQRLALELGLLPSQSLDLETLQLLASIRAHMENDVDVLVDVGAHRGAFVVPAFQVLRAKSAICFEPIPELLPVLRQNVSRIGAECHPFALADQPNPKKIFHVHQDQTMSSLLTSDLAALRRDFSTYDVTQVKTVEVEVRTLDSVLGDRLAEGRRFFLKLDTQGNELQVLRGGSSCIGFCEGIVSEYMFTTPYEGQSSFKEFHHFLEEAGFRCAAVLNVRRKKTHRISAVDLLFLPA